MDMDMIQAINSLGDCVNNYLDIVNMDSLVFHSDGMPPVSSMWLAAAKAAFYGTLSAGIHESLDYLTLVMKPRLPSSPIYSRPSPVWRKRLASLRE